MRNDVEVILVGDELLRGERSDAHLAFIASAARRVGARTAAAHVAGDHPTRIAALVNERLPHARVLVLTGGLGPTDDDVTREGVAEALGAALEFREDEWQTIVQFMESRGRPATAANRRQAYFPHGATVLANPVGTAAGFFAEAGETAVFVLPGPPMELQPMMESLVLPRLAEIFGRPPVRVERFRTTGIAESQLFEQLAPDTTQLSAYTVSWLPSIGGVDVVLTQRTGADAGVLDAEAMRIHGRLDELLGSKYYTRGDRALAEVAGDMLVARGETVAVAESLTGGGIARLFTDHAGASAYFLAGAVTYSNESKTELLGVRAETIAEFGAVSEETCTEMAHGIRRRAHATWGVATTGIAGPGGGTSHKPVGLTFIGVAWDGGVQVRRAIFPGGRGVVRARAAHTALWLLYDQLRRRG
ncbi:MAG TPA: CinA family nicotinamide mononucleotide deamidase-related protein [Candidatus Krumholzibacteria bacterium]|nr:CinA family nicotinamide mononucleotide deamidase-related protein [Candidatus Krumholzibacteria bacterium]